MKNFVLSYHNDVHNWLELGLHDGRNIPDGADNRKGNPITFEIRQKCYENSYCKSLCQFFVEAFIHFNLYLFSKL